MRDRRLAYALLAVGALVVLFFVFRPDDDDGETGAGTTTTAVTTPTVEPPSTQTDTETTPTTPTETQPAVTRWRVDSRDAELDRLTVSQDTRVRLVVIADVTDHVHVHGYDLMADVAPGAPAVIQFAADATGRFEIELEDRGREIAQLTVEP
jgi:heme/copper-type cytochrome/quinol oxidase subunit 2